MKNHLNTIYTISLLLLCLAYSGNTIEAQSLKSQEVYIDSISESNPVLAANLSWSLYEQSDSLNDTLYMIKSLCSFADALQLMGKFDSALLIVDEALILSDHRYILENALGQNIKAEVFIKKGRFDEALNILLATVKILANEKQEEEVLRSLFSISNCFDMKQMYSEAISTLQIITSLSTILNNKKYLFLSFNRAFYVFFKAGKSVEPLINKMIEVSKDLDDMEQQVTLYNNMAAYFTIVNDDKWAEYCFLKAYEISHELNEPQRYAIVALNLCSFYNKTGRWDEAEVYFEECMLNKEFYREDTWQGLYFFFESIYYYKNEKRNQAITSLERALIHLERINNYSLLLNVYNDASRFYEESGDYQNAYKYLALANEVEGILEDNNKDGEVNRLYYSVLLDLETEKAKTILLRNENLEQQRNIYILLIAIAAILIIVTMLFFYFYSSRFRRRILRIEKQHESVLAARLLLSRELSERNKEIASVVLNQVMQNEQSRDVIQRLRGIGEKSSKETQKELFELAGILGSSQNKNIWNEFEKYFKQLNPDFFSRISAKHSNLTSRDLRYCALISLQLSSKELSLITGMTLQSIHVLRSRLRNKLDLEKDDDLAVYLSSFSAEA